MIPDVPLAAASPPAWVRLAGQAINYLLNRTVVTSVNGLSGDVTVSGGGGGGGGYTYVGKSATYTETATTGEWIIGASGTFTINLPTAVGNTAKFTIKLVGAGTVTIDPNGAQTIDGGATAVLSTLNEAPTLVSNGANWLVV